MFYGILVFRGFQGFSGILKYIIMTKHLVLTQSKPPFIPQDPQALPLKNTLLHENIHYALSGLRSNASITNWATIEAILPQVRR